MHFITARSWIFFFTKETKKGYFAAPLNLALRLSVAIISPSVAVVAYGRVKHEKNRREENLGRVITRVLLAHTPAFVGITSHPLSSLRRAFSGKRAPALKYETSGFVEDFFSLVCKRAPFLRSLRAKLCHEAETLAEKPDLSDRNSRLCRDTAIVMRFNLHRYGRSQILFLTVIPLIDVSYYASYISWIIYEAAGAVDRFAFSLLKAHAWKTFAGLTRDRRDNFRIERGRRTYASSNNKDVSIAR